jgi:ABC-type uncharacterized transport system permease subunit
MNTIHEGNTTMLNSVNYYTAQLGILFSSRLLFKCLNTEMLKLPCGWRVLVLVLVLVLVAGKICL